MPLHLVLTIAAVFISVALFTGTLVSKWLEEPEAGRRRLRASAQPPAPKVLADIAPTLSVAPIPAEWKTVSSLLMQSEKDINKLRVRLTRAGFRNPGAPFVYLLVERIGPLVVAALPLLLLPQPLSLVAAAIAGFLAYMAPGLTIGQRLAKRKKEIENGLPDALDLLVVCIEAGSGIDQAIMKAGEELALAYPALSDELRILNMEIRAGKSRLEAFKNLAQRTKIDDVRALVAMLIQTDRFGTSIGQALRTHSEVSRTKRRQRAEERAQQIGVKLVFPLVLCFFPAFFVVVLGPAVIQFAEQFSK